MYTYPLPEDYAASYAARFPGALVAPWTLS